MLRIKRTIPELFSHVRLCLFPLYTSAFWCAGRSIGRAWSVFLQLMETEGSTRPTRSALLGVLDFLLSLFQAIRPPFGCTGRCGRIPPSGGPRATRCHPVVRQTSRPTAREDRLTSE